MNTPKNSSIERLSALIKALDMSASAFSKKVLKRDNATRLYNYLRGETPISEKLYVLIEENLPEINGVWLRTGVGEMFKNGSHSDFMTEFLDMKKRIEELEREKDVLRNENAQLMREIIISKGISLGKYEGKTMLPKVELYRIGNPKRVLFTRVWGLDRSQFGSYPARR